MPLQRLQRWLVVLCLALLQALAAAQQTWDAGKGTELSCSIMVWGNQDYLWNVTKVTKNKNGVVTKNYTSHCMETVRRARQRCGGTRLNFVPTHFWKFTDPVKMTPDRFCYKTNPGNDQVPVVCTDIVDWYEANQTTSSHMIWQFYKGMKGCFITAIWEGFTELKITPHLDDGTGNAGWRNTLGLDPWIQHHGYSYVDIMLQPLARAVGEALNDTGTLGKVKVMFTLQGEMNYALAAYPNSWLGVANKAREWIAGDKHTPEMAKTIKIGVSLNFNKLCGFYCAGTPIVQSTGEAMDMQGFKSLLEQMEYLGISSYPSLANGLAEDRWDFEGPIDTLDRELRQTFNFGVMDLVNYNDKEFHLSEFGIGGGADNCGCQPATTLQELQDMTYFGLFGTYGQFPDPWSNDWARAFRQDFYKHAIMWLSNKGGPNYKVDGAFLWCMSSWDVTAIYWTSWNVTTNQSYLDPIVTTMVKNWNDNRWLPCPPEGC